MASLRSWWHSWARVLCTHRAKFVQCVLTSLKCPRFWVTSISQVRVFHGPCNQLIESGAPKEANTFSIPVKLLSHAWKCLKLWQKLIQGWVGRARHSENEGALRPLRQRLAHPFQLCQTASLALRKRRGTLLAGVSGRLRFRRVAKHTCS